MVICVAIGYNFELETRYVRHVSMFEQEEIIHGVSFAHSIVSDQGAVKEEFFISKIPVQKDEYYKEIELAQLSDLRKEREKIESKKQSRIEVVDQAQLAIIEKLIAKRLDEITLALESLHHEQLKQYYVYQKNSVESWQQLFDLKQFVQHSALKELKELLGRHDMPGLQKMLDSVDSWPDRLDLFFKESVQNAIKNCDDTAVLKELLTLLSQ